MPPAGERCYGCNRLAPPALRNLAPGGRRRCDTCDRLNARWQVCDLAGCALRRIPQQPARCQPVVALPHPRRASALAGAVGFYACFVCFFANKCTLAGKLPFHNALERTRNPSVLLAPVHLQLQVHIDLWLMPCRDRCIYHIARIILWRLFGVVAGILSGGGHGSRSVVARKVNALKGAGEWPQTDAPVVFVGITPSSVSSMAARGLRALSDAEKGRLHGFRRSLTRMNGATAGLDWARFNEEPGAACHRAVPLVQKLTELLRDIGMTSGGHLGLNHGHPRTWRGNTDKERAFRRSLHTSAATLFA